MRGGQVEPWFFTLLITVVVLAVARIVWSISVGLFRRAVYWWYGETPE